MSRKRVGYDFCPIPRKRHPAWGALKHMLGNCLPEKLWQLADGAPIPVAGDWRVSLCRDLAINSRHRTNWCQAMNEAHQAGLLTVTETHVTVHFTDLPTATLLATNCDPTETLLATNCDPTETQPVTNLDSSPCNDSGRVSQTDRRDRQTDETERGRAGEREDLIGFNFVASLLGRDTFSIPPLGAALRQYTWIGGRPETERAAVKLAVEADPWCQANKHLVDGKHLELRWQRYLGGAPKPVVRAEPEVRKPVLEMHQAWKPMEYFYPKLGKAAAE